MPEIYPTDCLDIILFKEITSCPEEDDMIDTGEDLSADVYKASHHGSKTGSSDDFLDKVSPAYAVISCGEGNKYGHPSAQTLNNFRSRGIKTFRTDNQGTIVAYSDGSDIIYGVLLVNNETEVDELKREHIKLLEAYNDSDEVLSDDEYVNYFISRLSKKFKFTFIPQNELSCLYI